MSKVYTEIHMSGCSYSHGVHVFYILQKHNFNNSCDFLEQPFTYRISESYVKRRQYRSYVRSSQGGHVGVIEDT